MGKIVISKSEIDSIVSRPKYIDDARVLDPPCYGEFHVYMVQPPNYDLIFTIYKKAYTTALKLCGERIRGLNWHLRYHNYKCTYVYGWHDHMNEGINVSGTHGDKIVAPVPELKDRERNLNIAELINVSLTRWNITIKGNLPLLLFSSKK